MSEREVLLARAQERDIYGRDEQCRIKFYVV